MFGRSCGHISHACPKKFLPAVNEKPERRIILLAVLDGLCNHQWFFFGGLNDPFFHVFRIYNSKKKWFWNNGMSRDTSKKSTDFSPLLPKRIRRRKHIYLFLFFSCGHHRSINSKVGEMESRKITKIKNKKINETWKPIKLLNWGCCVWTIFSDDILFLCKKHFPNSTSSMELLLHGIIILKQTVPLSAINQLISI